MDRGRFQDEQSQPRCWRNLWHPNKDFHLMRAMPRVPVKARLVFVLNRLDSRNYWPCISELSTNWICIANVSTCFGSKDNFRTFQVQNLRSIPPKKAAKTWWQHHLHHLQLKHFSIYSCKTSYTSSTFQPFPSFSLYVTCRT